MSRPATHLFPASRTESEELALARSRFRTRPAKEPEWTPDPAPPDLAHWRAVWMAAGAIELEDAEGTRWEAEQDEMRVLAAALDLQGVTTSQGDFKLVALLPPPPSIAADDWVAVYLHAEHHELPNAWELGSGATIIERVAPRQPKDAVIWHVAADGLVRVQTTPFLDLHPEFFAGGTLETADGDELEWHQADDFGSLPEDADSYALAEAYHGDTKIGGFPAFNGADLAPEGAGFVYAYALGASFFDCEFGDAGTLHIWLSPSGDVAAMDSA